MIVKTVLLELEVHKDLASCLPKYNVVGVVELVPLDGLVLLVVVPAYPHDIGLVRVEHEKSSFFDFAEGSPFRFHGDSFYLVGLARLKLKVHKYALCPLEKSFVVRVFVLVRLKGFVLPAIVSANPHWRGVGWLEFEKFSLLDLLDSCYLHFEKCFNWFMELECLGRRVRSFDSADFR